MDEVYDGKEMNIKHDLYLSPFEKYKLYGIFPLAFFISLMLVLTTTCQVLFIINVNSNYSYQQLILWNSVFLNWDVQGSDTSLTNSYHIFHMSKLKSYVKTSVERYYDINSNTLDNYDYYYEDNGTKKPVKLYVNFADRDKAKDRGFKTEYDLNPVNLGPFEDENNYRFLDIVDTFSLEFKLKHELDDNFPTSNRCFTWAITQNYHYSNHGPITVKLDTDRGICGGDENFFNNKFLLLNCMVFVFAIWSIVLIMNSVYNRVKIVSNFKHRASVTGVWESLSLKERLKFISLWSVFNFASNICQILGAISSVFNGNIVLQVQESTVGFGCFMAWVGMIQYLKPNPNAYTVGNTLTRSFGTLGPYIIGILPIFLAFVFFAMAVLWKTGNYNSLSYAMTLQFAMLNGDSIYTSLSAAVANNNFFGMLYMYTFLVFFICVIHNIFIAIISDSYESLKTKPIKRGDESEEELDQSEFSPPSSVLLRSPKQGKDKDKKGKKIKKDKAKKAFRNLLEEKVLPTLLIDPRTSYYIKKIHSITKKITKKIEKMSKIAAGDDSGETNTKTLQERLQDLLLVNLEKFIDRLKQP